MEVFNHAEDYAELYPLCIQMARQIDGNRDLPLKECLKVLAKDHFSMGTGIPEEFQDYPLRAPDNPRLNAILEHSMRVQMGTIPGTELFESICCGHLPIATTILMHGYLTHLGIESDLVRGTIEHKHGKGEIFSTWLEVGGKTVDSTYFRVQPKNFICMCVLKHSGCYLKDKVPPLKWLIWFKLLEAPDMFEKILVMELADNSPLLGNVYHHNLNNFCP